MKAKPRRQAKIDARTCRPNDAYPKNEPRPQPYVEQFSRALGLRPAETMFGKRKEKV